MLQLNTAKFVRPLIPVDGDPSAVAVDIGVGIRYWHERHIITVANGNLRITSISQQFALTNAPRF